MSIADRNYGFSAEELQRLFGRSGGYESDRWHLSGRDKSAANDTTGGNGSIYSQVTKSDNHQMSWEEQVLADGAKKLDGMCRTGARVTGGNAYRSKIEYHFNKPHGFTPGRYGNVEVPDDYRVRIHR